MKLQELWKKSPIKSHISLSLIKSILHITETNYISVQFTFWRWEPWAWSKKKKILYLSSIYKLFIKLSPQHQHQKKISQWFHKNKSIKARVRDFCLSPLAVRVKGALSCEYLTQVCSTISCAPWMMGTQRGPVNMDMFQQPTSPKIYFLMVHQPTGICLSMPAHHWP